jgi:hypothetical protein
MYSTERNTHTIPEIFIISHFTQFHVSKFRISYKLASAFFLKFQMLFSLNLAEVINIHFRLPDVYIIWNSINFTSDRYFTTSVHVCPIRPTEPDTLLQPSIPRMNWDYHETAVRIRNPLPRLESLISWIVSLVPNCWTVCRDASKVACCLLLGYFTYGCEMCVTRISRASHLHILIMLSWNHLPTS